MIIVYLHDDKGGKGEIAKRSPFGTKLRNETITFNLTLPYSNYKIILSKIGRGPTPSAVFI